MYLNIHLMNPNEDKELDCILAGADFSKTDDEPRLSPKLVGAVVTPMADAMSTQEMALHKGRVGETQPEKGSCQGYSLSFSPTLYTCLVIIKP